MADALPEKAAAPAAPGPAQAAGALLELSLGYIYSAALNSAARFGVADHLVDGPRTADELAEEVGVHAPHLYRVLRYLATREVFREDEEGRFHLTPLAQPLRTDSEQSMRDTIVLYGEAPFWEPAGRLHEAVRTGSTAFEAQHGIPFYQYAAANPDFGRAFNASMAAVSDALSDLVAQTVDLSQAKSVVDVGGGRGGLLVSVLRRNPHLTGSLFELENVLAAHLLDLPELTGRWKAEVGDFFTSVPSGADVYFLKHVLASWPDEQCVRILRNCREAMPAHGRLVVVNPTIPTGNDRHPGKTLDMVMMTVLNGRNRTRAEHEELLTAAGFEVARFTVAAPQASVFEAVVAQGA